MGCAASTQDSSADAESRDHVVKKVKGRRLRDAPEKPSSNRAALYERPKIELILLEPSTGNAPSARKMHTAIAVQDHSLIVFGGVSRTEDFDATDNLEASMNLEKVSLNRQTFRVSLKPPRVAVWTALQLSGEAPCARATHRAVLVDGTNMYIFGHQAKQDNELYVFNVAFSQWRKLKTSGSKPRPLSGCTLSLASRSLVVFGGEGDRGISNDLHIFSIEASNWVQVPPQGPLIASSCSSAHDVRKFLMPRRDHSAVVVNERLLIYGGFGVESDRLEFVEFSALTRDWSLVKEAGDIPLKRGAHCATIYEAYMIIFGGMRHGQYLNDLHVFNTVTGVWSAVAIPTLPGGFIPSPRCFAASSMVSDVWYIHGGGDEQHIFADFFMVNARNIARCADPSLPKEAERRPTLCSAAWDLIALADSHSRSASATSSASTSPRQHV